MAPKMVSRAKASSKAKLTRLEKKRYATIVKLKRIQLELAQLDEQIARVRPIPIPPASW
jgi:hypothetical protein